MKLKPVVLGLLVSIGFVAPNSTLAAQSLRDERVMSKHITAFVDACLSAYETGALGSRELSEAGFSTLGKKYGVASSEKNNAGKIEHFTVSYIPKRKVCSGLYSGALINLRNVTPFLVNALSARGFRQANSSSKRKLIFTNGANVVQLRGSSSSGYGQYLVGFDLRLKK